MAIQRQLLIPLGTALAGFAVGWGLKPAVPTASNDPAAVAKGENRTTGGGGTDRNRDPRATRPTGVRTAAVVAAETTPEDAQLQNRLEKAFKGAASQRDRAKLVRISEALGLSSEQIDRLEVLLAEQRQSNTTAIGLGAGMSPKETLEKATEAAKALDAKFRDILGPEQVAALDTLQARQQENRAEAQAQRELSDVIDRIDVNTAQRDAVLEVLRKSITEEQSQRPEGSNLLGESSLLGAGGHAFSDRSLEAMRVLGDTAIGNDPFAVGQKMLQIQREQTLKRAEALAQILTPGQLEQYRAALEGQTGVSGATLPRK